MGLITLAHTHGREEGEGRKERSLSTHKFFVPQGNSYFLKAPWSAFPTVSLAFGWEKGGGIMGELVGVVHTLLVVGAGDDSGVGGGRGLEEAGSVGGDAQVDDGDIDLSTRWVRVSRP